MKCACIPLIVVLMTLLNTGFAQTPAELPDTVKPVSQTKQDTFLYPELEPEPGKYVVPPVVDRPLDAAGGPRIKLEAVELRGVIDRPKKGLRIDDVWAIIEQARAASPDGMTIGELQELANKITDHYRESGFIVAHAFIPVQTVEDGIITIQVLEGTLGRVLVEGGKKYKPSQIAEPFADLLGQPLVNAEVESTLVRLSDYPGLTSFGVFQPGQEVGSSDLVLRVQEEKGATMTYSLNNHGSRLTGEYLSRFDLSVHNMFSQVDQLDLAFQRAMSPSSAGFMSFEYSQKILSPQYLIKFGQDESDFIINDIGGTGITGVRGKSRIIYLGFRNDFERGRNSNAHWMITINRKTIETYQDDFLLAGDELAVVSMEYGIDFRDIATQSFNNLLLQFHHGEPDWLGSMGAHGDLGSSRRLDSGEFIGARFNRLNIFFTRLQTLSAFRSFLFRTAYQYTSDPLLGSEQFSMGGPDNVRAFSASEFTVDRGIFISGEHIWNAPGFADKLSPFGNRKWGEIFSVSAFAEWAHGERIDQIASEDTFESIKGWGLGAQLAIPGLFTAKLTAAWPMMDTALPANGRRPQLYLNFEADLF